MSLVATAEKEDFTSSCTLALSQLACATTVQWSLCKILKQTGAYQKCKQDKPYPCTVVGHTKKRSAEDTITNITLGSALKNWVEWAVAVLS